MVGYSAWMVVGRQSPGEGDVLPDCGCDYGRKGVLAVPKR
jgi:hypothetical protein